jgi:hypothetical protein
MPEPPTLQTKRFVDRQSSGNCETILYVMKARKAVKTALHAEYSFGAMQVLYFKRVTARFDSLDVVIAFYWCFHPYTLCF